MLFKAIIVALLAFMGYQHPSWILAILGGLVTGTALCQMGKSGITLFNVAVMTLFSSAVGLIGAIVGLALAFLTASDNVPLFVSVGFFVVQTILVTTQDRCRKSSVYQ